jgi:molecular chaperone GrpE
MAKDKRDKQKIEINGVDSANQPGESQGDELDGRLQEFTPDGRQAPAAASPSDQATELRRQIREAEARAGETAEASPEQATEAEQVAELKDQLLRKEAEFQNYRKRMQKDMEDARRFAVEKLLADMFPAFDALAQALAAYKDTPEGENPLVDGIRRTAKVMDNAFARHGIEKINNAGVPFDAELHQALNVEPSSDVAEDTVGEVYVEGYRLGGTVLKPAMVKVLKAE